MISVTEVAKMLNTRSLKTARRIASALFGAGFIAILGGMSCYREVAMPVIINPTGDNRSSELSEQTTSEGQDVQGLRCLPDDQTKVVSELIEGAASDRPKERIAATPEQSYGLH